MQIYLILELCIYLVLLPIVYKVMAAIDVSKIFKKGHLTEIKMFYFLIIIIITKIVGDVVIMIMDYIRLLLNISP